MIERISNKLAGSNKQNQTGPIQLFNTHFVPPIKILYPVPFWKKSWHCWLNTKLSGPHEKKRKKEKIEM